MENNYRFDRFAVSYRSITGEQYCTEYETLHQAVKSAELLKRDRNIGLPRSANFEDTELTIRHNIYYGEINLRNQFHFSSNAIYTCWTDDGTSLDKLAEKADYTPEVDGLYVCGNMDSMFKSFAVVKSVDEENNTLTADLYRRTPTGTYHLVASSLEQQINGDITSFKELYHPVDDYSLMEFKSKQEKPHQKRAEYPLW